MITATSATPVVDVALPADAESLVHPGQQVTITLPGGAPTPGRVLRVNQSAPARAGAGLVGDLIGRLAGGRAAVCGDGHRGGQPAPAIGRGRA